MNNKGLMVIADIYTSGSMPDAEIEKLCEVAIKQSNMNVVDKLSKHFEPHGLTVLWLLSESHFSLHTYPEHNYFSVDCYTCGSEGNPKAAMDYIIGNIDVSHYKSKIIERG